MHNLLRKLLSKFIKPSVIENYRLNLDAIEYSNPANQLDNSKLFVGLTTASEIRKKLDEGDISGDQVNKFYSSVRAFYSAAVAYVLKWFPLNEAIIKDSQFVDFNQKAECDFSMVLNIVAKYPKLLHFKPDEIDKLNEEFVDYQALSKSDIPDSVWDQAVCYETDDGVEKKAYHRMDVIWGFLADMKIAQGINIQRFAVLPKVAHVVLTIPHSNAGEERVFSVIHKIKREDRGRLMLEGSLSALLTVKLNHPETKSDPCYSFKPSQDLLKQAKKATSFYNKQVCSSKTKN